MAARLKAGIDRTALDDDAIPKLCICALGFDACRGVDGFVDLWAAQVHGAEQAIDQGDLRRRC